MDEATILGCRAKRDRAEASVKEMATEWSAWIDTHPYPSRIDVGPDLGEYRLFFDFSTPIPPAFGVRVGEIAHHLRSALDHLVWREAVEFLKREPTKSEAWKIQYPICRFKAELPNASVKPFVGPNAWAIIERCQPYKGRQFSGLALLHWINRIDKHRLLHGGTVSLSFFNPLRLVSFDLSAPLLEAPMEQSALGRPLKGETQIARFKFAVGAEPDMRVQRTPALNIAFGDAPADLGAVELAQAVRQVRLVVNEFTDIVE